MFFLLGLGVLIAVFVLMRKRGKKLPEHPLTQLREGTEDVLADLEARIDALGQRAKRLSGEAQRRLQGQIKELEERQRDLRRRLDDLAAEAKRLLDRTRSQD